MSLLLLPGDIHGLYEVHEWRHASAVLSGEFPSEWKDIIEVLRAFRLPRSQIVKGGGRKTDIAGGLDKALSERGWVEKCFATKIVVDDNEMESPTHKVDCFKNRVALEIEWNNKDPFFDRDLNNFRLLFDLRAISVGVIVTRADHLQEIFDALGKRNLVWRFDDPHEQVTAANRRRRWRWLSDSRVRYDSRPVRGGLELMSTRISEDKFSAGRDLLARCTAHYGTILADPPWQFSNRTGKMAPEHRRLSRYSTMTLEEIMDLPVAQVAAPRSHLYLWVPNALIAEGLQVMQRWGFTYKTNLVWYKVRGDGGPDGRGVGFYFRNVTELILFGIRGSMRTLDAGRRQTNIIVSRKREHSRKPDEQYEIIEQCSPGPYLELFARHPRENWSQWGNEIEETAEGTARRRINGKVTHPPARVTKHRQSGNGAHVRPRSTNGARSPLLF